MQTRRDTLALAAALLAIPNLSSAREIPKLLLVHGRAQQGRDQDVIKEEWIQALRNGAQALGKMLPESLDVDLPFYGDILDSYTKAAGVPLTSDIGARGSKQDDEFLVFQAQFAEQVRLRAGITDEQVDAEYGDNPQVRGPLNWAWVQAILRAIDKNGGGMNQAALEVFTRDVYLYITRAGVRDEVNRVVSRVLTEQPTIVIAHSLGTVVAYSVLRNDTRQLKIPLFATVGSPLAVRAVRDQLRPLRSLSVDTWYNAFDTRDVVALYPLDQENFPMSPTIDNYSQVRNATDNRHGISGYLDDRDVATHILDALSG